MGFTSSLVLWFIWYLSKNMRPLNILSGTAGRITLPVFIKSVFSLQAPAYAIRSTDSLDTDAVHSKKHLNYPHSCSSQVCAWNGKQLRIQKYLGFLRHLKENMYLVPTPHPQLHSVLQLYLLELLSLKDTAAELQAGYVSENKWQSCSYMSLSWSRCTKTVQDWVCTTSCGKTAVLNPKSQLQFCF